MLPDFTLNNRRALVTGASSGLGRHFAKLMAAAGAEVFAAARRTDRLQDLVSEITAAGGRAQAVALDVTDRESVVRCFDEIVAQGGCPDLIINNAGAANAAPALQLSEDEWDLVVDTNLKGAWLVCQEAGKRLVEARKGGSIVNITSLLAERVAGGTAPYAASKAGLRQLTESLALDWARYGIRVNAIAPGYIATDLNREFLESPHGQKMLARVPQRRFGTPESLDGTMLLLASEAGSFITGAFVAVDGGHLVSSL